MRRVALAAAEAEIEFQRPADGVAHRVARIERHVGRLVDHLDAPQLLARALLEGRPAAARR